ncbi:hypothetical protein EBZ39_03800 [bacterium]|nr:hypothetical protein [bacterium]
MASTYSTNLAIELIGSGDQAGSWGTTTNTNLGTLIEQAISGYVTQAMTTGNTTTITIPNGATGVARNMYIEMTGTGGSNTFLVVPANKKLYFIYNNTTGAVTVKVSGQTGVSVAAGEKTILVSNGTDVVSATSYAAGSVSSVGLSFTGGIVSVSNSPITSSGTIALTVAGTSGGIPYFSSGSTWASSGALASNAIVVGGGAGAAPSTTTTGTGVVTAIGNAVNTTGGLVTQSGTLTASSILLGGGSGTAISSTTTGTGVVTALGVNTGSAGAFVVNGGALGAPSSGNLANCTVDGTNAVGFKNIPQSGSAKTGAYTLATTDVGKFIQVSTGGSIVIPNSTFAAGDAVSVFNNTSGNVTVTCNTTNCYISGTDTNKTSVTLATRGTMTVLFVTSTLCVLTGNLT